MLTKKFFKTKDEVEVGFIFESDDASKVDLVADFTNWQPVAMVFNKKEKAFKTKLRLPKNEEFQFRYLINGDEWENDYQADKYLANHFGTDNSVISTRV